MTGTAKTPQESETLAQRAERLAAALPRHRSNDEIDEVLVELAAANAQLERERDEARACWEGEKKASRMRGTAAYDKAVAERDAAIRERDEMRSTAAGVTLAMTKARDAANAARAAAEGDAARYRYLREHCSSHYPMTWEQPAEWSIQWGFQQLTPAEGCGSFDALIDKDIARCAELERIDEEEAALTPTPEAPTDGE